MSAMAKMFADMLLKELPDEIREALTPENLQKIGNKVTEIFSMQESIYRASIHIANEQEAHKQLLERILENVSKENVQPLLPDPEKSGKRRGGDSGNGGTTVTGDGGSSPQ